MKEWRAKGDRLILLLDDNEDMKNAKLAWAIRLDSKLKMKDLVRERAHKEGPATWFRGTKQIYGTFASSDVDCCGDRFLTFCSGIGYHKDVVVDIPHQSLLGKQVLKVLRQEARRLQCGLPGPKRWYHQKCKTLFQEQKVYRKARIIYILARYSPPPGFKIKLYKWDN